MRDADLEVLTRVDVLAVVACSESGDELW